MGVIVQTKQKQAANAERKCPKQPAAGYTRLQI